MSVHDAGVRAPLRPPPRAGFSMKAAMIVPGIGVLILALFIGAGFLTSNQVQPTVVSTRSFSVPGTTLRAQPAVRALKVITVDGQPPDNIVNATSIPVGATRVSFQNNSASAQAYDAQIALTIDSSQGAVENFYSKDLKVQGWQIFETGPADNDPGAIEVLAKQAGSDGFYWEIGAVVSATTFGPGAPAKGSTSFTLRLFQQPDPD
ncbi:MAG: hypothetical protein ACLQRH_04020 [Acidimicrobiales bacterium]